MGCDLGCVQVPPKSEALVKLLLLVGRVGLRFVPTRHVQDMVVILQFNLRIIGLHSVHIDGKLELLFIFRDFVAWRGMTHSVRFEAGEGCWDSKYRARYHGIIEEIVVEASEDTVWVPKRETHV